MHRTVKFLIILCAEINLNRIEIDCAFNEIHHKFVLATIIQINYLLTKLRPDWFFSFHFFTSPYNLCTNFAVTDSRGYCNSLVSHETRKNRHRNCSRFSFKSK